MKFNNNFEWYCDLSTKDNLKEFEKIPLNIFSATKNIYKEDISISVGYDGRINSKEIAKDYSSILSKCGAIVFESSDLISSSQFDYQITNSNSQIGIYITGGENPSNWNGIKIFTNEQFPNKDLFLENINSNESIVLKNLSQNKINYIDNTKDYYEYLIANLETTRLINYATQNPNKAGIIIDAMGGATATIVEDILTPLLWRSQTIFSEPDYNFYSRTPKIIESELESLRYNVESTESLLGIIFNGDGSDCGFINKNGEFISKNNMLEKISTSGIFQYKIDKMIKDPILLALSAVEYFII